MGDKNTFTYIVDVMAANDWAFCTLLWRHNGHDCVSNHQPHEYLLNRSFGRRSKKTSKLRVTGLCVGNSPETGEFPAQMASNAENISIWWRHHDRQVISNWTIVKLVMFYAVHVFAVFCPPSLWYSSLPRTLFAFGLWSHNCNLWKLSLLYV